MKLNVVIVEDDDDFRDLMSLALTHQGFEVTAFSSAESALAFIEAGAEKIEGLVADLVLAQGNGMQVCKRLAELNPLASIVVLSGNHRLLQSATDEGYRTLLKPIGMNVLSRVLRREPG
jgi:DNA-binding NtrC family response regulator